MGSPIDVGGQYPFITFFTPPRLSGKFLLDRVHEKGNLTFSLDFFRIPAPTPLNYVHSMGAGLQKYGSLDC